MLTTCLLLGSWLKVSGTLPLVPLYAFVILTRTSPDYSQLRVLGLVVVFNVTVIRLSSRLLVVYVCFIRHLNFTKSLSLSFLWGKKKLFPADVSLSWCRLEISFSSVNILWTLMSPASIERKKYGEYIYIDNFWHWHSTVHFWDDNILLMLHVEDFCVIQTVTFALKTSAVTVHSLQT